MTIPYPGLELLATAVLLLDDGLLVTYANPAAETLLAHGRKHLLGAPLGRVLPGNEAFLARLSQAVAEDAGFSDNELELVIGGEVATLHCVAAPVEEDGSRLLIELRELGEQIRIAREAKLVEQQQANRELIRNLAHEIKNPLGGIRGAAQLLEMEVESRALTEYTQVIINEADRLQALVDRLLAPHRKPHVVSDVNIHEVCERVRSLIMAEFPKGLRVERDYDVSIPDFRGDREQLIQAVLNIAHNAAQALAERIAAGDAVITLRTRIARQVTLGKQRYRLALELHIEDNGPGVPESIREHIFYPLVSGREGGSGLGLTLAQTFVQQHQGTIECESEPGRTLFKIVIPLP